MERETRRKPKRQPMPTITFSIKNKHVYQSGGKWFFLDECEQQHGPFGSELMAITSINKYIKLNGLDK